MNRRSLIPVGLMLALAAVAAVAVVVAAGSGRRPSRVLAATAPRGNASLVQLAKAYVVVQAESQSGTTVLAQHVTGFTQNGGHANVSLAVTMTNGSSEETFALDVELVRTAWAPLGMHVTTEQSPPPIGVPAPPN